MDAPSFAADGFSSQAASGVLRYLQDGQFCDFELVCQGKRMPVHKAVVCSQSPVFETACSGRYQEAVSNSFEILDADIETVERMIQYLYTGRYTYALETSVCLRYAGFPSLADLLGTSPEDAKSKTERYVVALSAQIRLLALADKYLINKLAATVAVEFRHILSRHHAEQFLRFLDVVPQVYALESASASLLRKECISATKLCFGPQLAVGAEHRQRLDRVFAATPEFSKEVLGEFLIVGPPLAVGPPPRKKQKVPIPAKPKPKKQVY